MRTGSALHIRDGMFSADTGDAAARLQVIFEHYAEGEELNLEGFLKCLGSTLRTRYAIPGTDLAYGATR